MKQNNWSVIQPAEVLEISRKYIFKEDLLPQFMSCTGAGKGIEMADIGCGTGSFTRYLKKGMGDAGHITGVDLLPEFISYASQKASEENLSGISFQEGSAYSLPFADSSLDAVTDHTMLVNLQEPEKAVKEELRVLKDGGVISTAAFLTEVKFPERLIKSPDFNHLYEIQSKLHKLIKEHIIMDPPQGGYDRAVFGLAGLYQSCGVKEVQVNGIVSLYSPDDWRYKHTREEWIKTQYQMQQWEIRRFMQDIERWEKHGLHYEDLELALELLKKQYEYDLGHTTWIFLNTVEVIISGKK